MDWIRPDLNPRGINKNGFGFDLKSDLPIVQLTYIDCLGRMNKGGINSKTQAGTCVHLHDAPHC